MSADVERFGTIQSVGLDGLNFGIRVLNRVPSLTVNHFSIRTYGDSRHCCSAALRLLSRMVTAKGGCYVREFFCRTAAWALSVTLGLGAAVAPCAAAGKDAHNKSATTLTRLSPASQQLLVRASTSAGSTQDQPGGPNSSGSFFRSKRGAVTLILMGAGTAFTVWSINHDRKPVKSPIR